jgi:hypothetical protein
MIIVATVVSLIYVNGCTTGGLFGAKEPKQPETVVDYLGQERPSW